MQKQNDVLTQFTSLRSALLRERDTLHERIQQIEAALASNGGVPVPLSQKRRGRPPGKRIKSTRPENTMTMREAISKATARTALSVREIVDAVKTSGYKFATKDPVNSVGAFLYGGGKKHFKRANGKFSPK